MKLTFFDKALQSHRDGATTKGKFDAAVNKYTRPARELGDNVKDITTKMRRAMGDYSDAPLIDLDGDGMLNRQFKKTGKEINSLKDRIRKKISGEK